MAYRLSKSRKVPCARVLKYATHITRPISLTDCIELQLCHGSLNTTIAHLMSLSLWTMMWNNLEWQEIQILFPLLFSVPVSGLFPYAIESHTFSSHYEGCVVVIHLQMLVHVHALHVTGKHWLPIPCVCVCGAPKYMCLDAVEACWEV